MGLSYISDWGTGSLSERSSWIFFTQALLSLEGPRAGREPYSLFGLAARFCLFLTAFISMADQVTPMMNAYTSALVFTLPPGFTILFTYPNPGPLIFLFISLHSPTPLHYLTGAFEVWILHQVHQMSLHTINSIWYPPLPIKIFSLLCLNSSVLWFLWLCFELLCHCFSTSFPSDLSPEMDRAFLEIKGYISFR